MYHLIISTENYQDPRIQRLTGIAPSEAVLIADFDEQSFLIFLDSRYSSWELDPLKGWKGQILDRTPDWSILQPYGKRFRMSQQYSWKLHQEIVSHGYDIVIDDQVRSDTLAAIKTPSELQTMHTCYDLTLQVLAYIQSQIDDGSILTKTCLQLRGECITYAMSLGLEGEAFGMIVATGVQTASPHHHTDATQIAHGPLLIDMGWKLRGYCSDMTRCRRVGERTGEDYKTRSEIYHIVQTAKDACVTQSRLDMTGQQIDATARGVIDDAGYGDAFTHSTGHGIGVQVHELPWITKSDRGLMRVEEGMCLTIEPGIYLPGQMGVRLEDSYVMTIGGLQQLGLQ